MSDEQEIEEFKKRNGQPTVTVQIDRSAEIARLEQEKEDLKTQLENEKTEKLEYKSALEILSEKELKAKLEHFGIDGSGLTDEEKIERVKQAEINATRGMTGFSSDMINNGNPQPKRVTSNTGYDSIPDMVLDLNRKAKSNDVATAAEADAILAEMNKLSLKAIRTHGRESFQCDINPEDLKKLREQSKMDIAQKRLKRQ